MIRATVTLLLVSVVGSLTTMSGPSTTTSALGRAYGSVQVDSRRNHEVMQDRHVAYRFRASTSSAVNTIQVQQRGGSGYSAGDGGAIQVTIETDAAGKPSGTALATTTFSPGNPAGPWEVWTPIGFAQPPELTAGQLYHVVFRNVSGNPAANYISLNVLFYWGSNRPRQATISDDFAVLVAAPSSWTVQGSDTPVIDIEYANGTHDGIAYIGALIEYYGWISGTTLMVRERFTVSGGNKRVATASVKVKRISGSGALTIRLEHRDGSGIEAVTIPASKIPVGRVPTGAGKADLSGNTWATATFRTPRLLVDGRTYNLRLSTTKGTRYLAVPVQEGTDKGLSSYRFTDGHGQRTIDGGAHWRNLYQWEPVDLQFYFR